jgi:hypothetical protein
MSVFLRRAIRAASQPSIWLAVVLGLDAVIAVAAIVVGRSVDLSDLLAAAPLLACARCGGRVPLWSQATQLPCAQL